MNMLRLILGSLLIVLPGAAWLGLLWNWRYAEAIVIAGWLVSISVGALLVTQGLFARLFLTRNAKGFRK